MSLYGMEPDGALSDLPDFATNFGGGRDCRKTLTRGGNDPATCVLKAVNAQRVPAESIDFCTWNDTSTQPELFKPFSDINGLFHVFELPKRRAVDGSEKPLRSYGIRLGPKASGAWSNRVSDKKTATSPSPSSQN